MLTRIDLRHFKCFERLNLPLAPLTLLSGPNASGKSTALQALALVHQTMREQEWSPRLMLNGEILRLGTVRDVIDKEQGRRTFGIRVHSEQSRIQWVFRGKPGDMSAEVESVWVGKDPEKKPKRLHYLVPSKSSRDAIVLKLRGLNYLTAERAGPREVYPLEDRQTAGVVGPRGEHTVSVLDWGRDETVIEALCIPDEPPTLLRQVEARMGTFFPGFGMIVQPVAGANAVTLGLRTSTATDFHRPPNVGFGLTQVLPIVTAVLSASPGSLVLIENPEVHLHPAGQAQMGQFLAKVAAAGIQVLLETHSDHVLNGVRRAVKSDQISYNDVALHFFRPRSSEDGGAAQVESPQIGPDGGVDYWPEGFFDQFDRDTAFFAGWGS